MADDPLDHFGEFVSRELRDKFIEHVDDLCNARWKSPGLQALQAALQRLSTEQKALVHRAAVSAADAAVHDFLFQLQERADFENRIRVLVDGEDVVSISDGIHGEAFSEDGWYARFSRFGIHPDTA